MRIIITDAQSLKHQHSPMISRLRPRKIKIKKRKENQRDSKTAPNAQKIAVHFIVLVNQRIKCRKEAVYQPVDDPNHRHTSAEKITALDIITDCQN